MFKTPKSCCLPYGSLENALKNSNDMRKDLITIFEKLNNALDIQNVDQLHSVLVNEFNKELDCPSVNTIVSDYASKIMEFFSSSCELIAVRSSSNVEDLKKLSGAGLFDSILNIHINDQKAICDAIKGVWSSLYSKRAVQSRYKYKIKQEFAAMGILIQEMIPSDFSFIIHTSNPVNSIII